MSYSNPLFFAVGLFICLNGDVVYGQEYSKDEVSFARTKTLIELQTQRSELQLEQEMAKYLDEEIFHFANCPDSDRKLARKVEEFHDLFREIEKAESEAY